jgi:hypothetical protein
VRFAAEQSITTFCSFVREFSSLDLYAPPPPPINRRMLLLIAAVLHATANALMKRARDKLAFTWCLLTIASCHRDCTPMTQLADRSALELPRCWAAAWPRQGLPIE